MLTRSHSVIVRFLVGLQRSLLIASRKRPTMRQVTVLLIAAWLTACTASLESGTSLDRAATNASDGLTPSVNSTEPKASDRFARSIDSIAQKANNGSATPGKNAYRIGPLDVLDISVFQAPDLSKTVAVAEDGTIDLPLIGEIPAAGKTAYELQRDLNSKLGAKYLQNPEVTVLVKEFNSSRVTVSGAVKNPGVFPSKGQTLLQYVTMAGGLDETSNSTVLVLRQSGGKRSSAKFNVADIQAGRADDPISSQATSSWPIPRPLKRDSTPS
jgi:polysaccharide export outer membrane protein